MNRREFVKGSIALAGAAALGNIGCAKESATENNNPKDTTRKGTNEEGTKKMGGKSIVVYFSRTGENYSVGSITTGNTAKVARELAAQTGADTWEIKEVDAYPAAYTPCIERAKKELRDKARPAIQGEVPDLTQYDTVFLGYPNWWGEAPMVVYTFMDKAKVEGKTFYPFCTHEGSGLGSTARSLAKAYPKAKIGLKGLALYGHVAQKESEAVKSAVGKWLKDLGISK